MAPMIEISTRGYERVHGCKPHGYGLWHFQLPGGVFLSYAGAYPSVRRSVLSDWGRAGRRAAFIIRLCP